MRIWITNICSIFLDVHKANSRVSHQCRIGNNVFGRRLENRRYTSIAIFGTVFQNHFRIPMPGEALRAQSGSVILILIPLVTCPLIWLTTFQATCQRVPSQALLVRSQRSSHTYDLRHVSRTHRVDVDWPFKRINLVSSIPIGYVRSTKKLVHILAKHAFTTIQ